MKPNVTNDETKKETKVVSEGKSFKEKMGELGEQIESTDKAKQELDDEILKNDDSTGTDKEDEESVLDFITKNSEVTVEDIENWKSDFGGKVYTVFFDEDEFYIYRYLARAEYKDIMAQLAKSTTSNAQTQSDLFDELLCQRCLLFPKYTVDLKTTAPAGTFQSLSKQIQINSNFLDDRTLVQMIQKL